MDNINLNVQNVNANSFPGNLQYSNISNLDNAGLDLLKQMANGETLRGTVSDISNQVATISVGDTVINARINPDVNLNIGQTVVFEVSKDGSDEIALRALFTNLASENIANNAISQAGIPTNNTSLALVSTLMQEGMSIDKESLSAVYRQIMANPNIEPSEIINMQKLGLELSADNIARFDAVLNFESKLSDSIETLIKQLPMELSNMADSDLSASIDMAKDFIGSSLEGETGVFISLGNNGLDNENLMGNEEGELLNENANTEGNGTSQLSSENAPIADSIIKEIADGNLLDGDQIQIEVPKHHLSDEITLTNKDFDFINGLTSKDNEIANSLIDKLSDGQKVDLEDILKTFDSILKDPNISDQDKGALIKSALFKDLLTDKFSEKWLLEPEEIKDPGKISDHYNKLINNTNDILDSMSNVVKGSDNLTNSINGFRENVQFLQNLNDLTPYVQLPMMLNNQSNTGDLYVYANKKNLLAHKDNISAVLRLDMQALGMMEVYIRLNNSTNVSTDFTFEDEDALKFIELNIDKLNSKLEKLGYNVTNSFNTKSFAPAMFSGEDENNDKGDAISFYRFDVRA